MELLKSNKALLIAEVAQSHDGSLGSAHAFIDIVADAGFDAIKFQTHFADAESTYDEPFRIRFSRQDDTRYAYWKRMEFNIDQWRGLAAHAKDRSLLFLSTPFSEKAFEILESIGVPAWKIGSGEFKSWKLVQPMIDTGKPIILSSGMSNLAEIDDAVRRIQEYDNDLYLLQCTSRYPTKFSEVGLNVMSDFKRAYKCKVGLSDHSGSVWPSVVALSRGASMVEVHVTMHRQAFGPDVSSSLTPDELRLLVDARDAISVFDLNPVDKDQMANDLSDMRSNFTKSLALTHSMQSGSVLREKDLTSKKPGGGISESLLDEIVGRTLRKDVSADRLLRLDDLVCVETKEK